MPDMSERTRLAEKLSSPAMVFYRYEVDGGALLREAAAWLRRNEQLALRLAAVTQWLEKHHPEVFREGLWDAINDVAGRARP